MKKTISIILVICLAAFMLAGCAAAGDAAAAGTGNPALTFIPLLLVFVVMYVVMIIPENKRKKKAQQMRDSIEVGDKIVTIGGLVGKVVHVSSDKLTFETGEDRVRIEVTKWAVSSNEGKGANKETTNSEETLN